MVIGCSTAGEILGETVEDDTVTVAVSQFDSTRLTLLTADMPASRDSHRIGVDLAEQLSAGDADLKAIMVLSDGLRANGAELARGLSEIERCD